MAGNDANQSRPTPSLKTDIESLKIFGDEMPILANQFPIEIYFSPAVVAPLNEDEVPVDYAPVTVVGIFVGLAWSEMK